MKICLKAIRKQMGFTQQQLADSVALSQPAYANIESGRRRPSPETAQLLGAFMGFDWTVFFLPQGRDAIS